MSEDKHAKMKEITTKEEHAGAVKRLEELMSAESHLEVQELEELDRLAGRVEDYEKKRFPHLFPARHTPGPWAFSPPGDESYFKVVNTAGARIAVVMISDDEAANAYLLAAAPELLVALEETLEAVDLCTPDAPTPVEGSVIDKARKAIAKAKGEHVDDKP